MFQISRIILCISFLFILLCCGFSDRDGVCCSDVDSLRLVILEQSEEVDRLGDMLIDREDEISYMGRVIDSLRSDGYSQRK